MIGALIISLALFNASPVNESEAAPKVLFLCRMRVQLDKSESGSQHDPQSRDLAILWSQLDNNGKIGFQISDPSQVISKERLDRFDFRGDDKEDGPYFTFYSKDWANDQSGHAFAIRAGAPVKGTKKDDNIVESAFFDGEKPVTFGFCNILAQPDAGKLFEIFSKTGKWPK